VHEATLASKNFSRSTRIDEADAARLAIVVEELVANLYDHGGLGVDDAFEIELSATSTDISVVLIDPGTPFDPGLAKLGVNSPPRGGGAGLKLVRAWAKHIDYQSINGVNRLAVVLPR
jgi:anti-sigma regulatory factor (Ser/Thr protein kinase)